MNLDAPPGARAARDPIIAAAREAGTLALGFFRAGAATSAEVKAKHGGSPVTEADLAVDALLRQRLTAAFPSAGWLSEETADDAARLARRALLVVDPIDGTKAFVAGDARWAVSVALVVDGRPIAGVVHAAALDETYSAARGAGADLNGVALLGCERSDPERMIAAGPKPILEAMAAKLRTKVEIVPRVPSMAYRLCMAARGAVDFAVAAENSHDWDIAAADLILEEAGLNLVEPAGAPLLYNTQHIRRKMLLAAPHTLAPRLIEAFRSASRGGGG
ncbi:MAG TPA: 3'(2'),5'-bisphosphate nucleotidase CysQ [Roseiarcus sp.]|nr:3'(2'),5'-bisphosphate nucleotidase CysQ [Roseiarcus sp.]